MVFVKFAFRCVPCSIPSPDYFVTNSQQSNVIQKIIRKLSENYIFTDVSRKPWPILISNVNYFLTLRYSDSELFWDQFTFLSASLSHYLFIHRLCHLVLSEDHIPTSSNESVIDSKLGYFPVLSSQTYVSICFSFSFLFEEKCMCVFWKLSLRSYVPTKIRNPSPKECYSVTTITIFLTQNSRWDVGLVWSGHFISFFEVLERTRSLFWLMLHLFMVPGKRFHNSVLSSSHDFVILAWISFTELG